MEGRETRTCNVKVTSTISMQVEQCGRFEFSCWFCIEPKLNHIDFYLLFGQQFSMFIQPNRFLFSSKKTRQTYNSRRIYRIECSSLVSFLVQHMLGEGRSRSFDIEVESISLCMLIELCLTYPSLVGSKFM